MEFEDVDVMALWFASWDGVAHLAHQLELQGLCDEDESLRDARQLLPMIEAAAAAARDAAE